jgi:hypothetical protein
MKIKAAEIHGRGISMDKIILALTVFAVSFTAYAQEPTVTVLNFQSWKEQQVLEAQNQTLRISARISQLKSAKPGSAGAKDVTLPNGKVKKLEADSVAAAERDLRRSQDSLQTANALTLDDYVSVYLPTLQGQPEALQALSLKLSKEELAEIFKTLVGKGSATADAKKTTGLPSAPLTVTSRAKPE